MSLDPKKFFEDAAASDNALALNNLGLMYADGLGGDQNFDEAHRLFSKAFFLGDVVAAYNLGYLHEFGDPSKRDVAEAFIWYKRAAEAGYGRAQRNLAAIYLKGRAVSADPVQSYFWFCLAVDTLPEGESRNRALEGRDYVLARLSTEDVSATNEKLKAWKARPAKSSENVPNE